MRARMILTWVLLGLCTGVIAACSDIPTKEEALSRSIKNEIVKKKGDKVTQVIGPHLAEGPTPLTATQKYIDANAARHDVNPAELSVVADSQSGRSVQPVLFDKKTGDYRYNIVKYQQQKDGIPVFRSEMKMLVRNTSDFPVVMVNDSLRDIKGFTPPKSMMRAGVKAFSGAVSGSDPMTDFKGKALAASNTKLSNFSKPTQVIWAGLPDREESPRLAVTFTADNKQDTRRKRPERWLFVADQVTGDILYKENQVVFTNIDGSVNGLVTDGSSAMECAEAVTKPLPYAVVASTAGSSAITSDSGAFTLFNDGDSEVTLISALNGEYFSVYDVGGMNTSLDQTVVPPGPADFMHNAMNNDVAVAAQVNGYAMANEVRDWVLKYNPAYPGVADYSDFPVYVNSTDFYCPGNAWYDGLSINFCVGGDGFANTAFASVVHHEYGHHVIEMAGSGQDEYGEGMADAIAMLINDDPALGRGFFENDCVNPLRNADNDCQYDGSFCSTCGDEIHDCGQLLSGIIWSIRNELADAGVEDYLDLLSGILVNSILLHTGGRIDDQILTDFLTLDDDDGNINNGTPHREQICNGFSAHGIACPELKNFLTISAPESVNEADGVLNDAITVSIEWAIEKDLVVFVASEDMSEAEVNGYGIIPAGALSTTFDLTVVDDSLLDGTQKVRLVALAPDMVQDEIKLLVDDNETAALSLIVPADMTEGTVSAATVSVDATVDSDVTVSLSTSDDAELLLPAEVIIPAGKSSVDFEIEALDDNVFDGSKDVTVTAVVANWAAGTAMTLVSDDMRIRLSLPVAVTEGDGILMDAGMVSVSGVLDADIDVSLVSLDETEVIVPAVVTIPAGASFAPFDIEVIDDAIIDGEVDVTIESSAEDFISDAAVIQVYDNDPGTVSFSEPTYRLREDGGVLTVTVIRDPSSVGTISVDYETVDDIALAGEDYLATSGTLTFAPEETIKTFDVTILQDELIEGHEPFMVMLSNPTDGGELGFPEMAVVLIVDDDLPDFFTEGFGFVVDGDGGDYPEPEIDTDMDTDMETDGNLLSAGKVAVKTKKGFVNVTPEFDLAYKTMTLTPNGSGDFYSACITDAQMFPVDPADGDSVSLSDDDAAEVSLPAGTTVSLYGQTYSTFYVGSNGYITFNEPDHMFDPIFANHFNLPRISPLYTDLNPMGDDFPWPDGDTDMDTDWDTDWDAFAAPLAIISEDTAEIDTDPSDSDTPAPDDTDSDWPMPESETPVSVKVLMDRVVVTYDNILTFGDMLPNSFQVEMFQDGRIRITWLNIEAYYGIVGVSAGLGKSDYFSESDLSEYDSCISAECLTDADCTDGLFCNGAEYCMDGMCVPSTDVVCNDGVACTQDACSEDAGNCMAYPDDTQCDDGNACTLDVCDAVIGCLSTPIPGCCGDGICDGGETPCDCAEDCGVPAESEATMCGDGIDNDCDGAIDTGDSDCACNGDWQRCTQNADCCSGRCIGFPWMKWCQPAPQPQCATNADCDDSVFCNGSETCAGGQCVAGQVPCAAGDTCNEIDDQCEPPTCMPSNSVCQSNGDCCSGMCRGWGRFGRHCW